MELREGAGEVLELLVELLLDLGELFGGERVEIDLQLGVSAGGKAAGRESDVLVSC